MSHSDETPPAMAVDQDRSYGSGASLAASDLEVPASLMMRIVAAAGDRDPVSLRQIFFEELHPADAADALEHLSDYLAVQTARILGFEFPPAIWVELQSTKRRKLLQHAPPAVLARALGAMDSDDAALVADDIDEDQRAEVLAAIPRPERITIEAQLAFDEETAGRLMQRDFVAAPEFWTIGQAIDHMRSVASDLPDVFFDVYIVDPGFRPIGAVPLAALLKSPRTTPLAEVMAPLEVIIPAEMDQEEIALRFQRYHLASAPVVDSSGRLTGMILVDDIVDVIQEENQEDFLALHGVEESGPGDSVWTSVRARLPWLGVNLAAAFCSAALINLFQGSIAKMAALAALMPLIASLGGNVGAQTLAVAVRALASRELNDANAWRAVLREGLTALVNGLAIATLAALIVTIWFGDPKLAGVVWAAMTGAFLWAGLMGILAPLALRRLGADPAVASSVFVLTSIDLVGFLLFLGLATLYIVR